MTPGDVQDLLALCQGFDNRKTVDDFVIAAWGGALHDINPVDAQQAVVEHYRETRDFIMPADIRTRAQRIAKQRAAGVIAQHSTPGCREIITEFGLDAAEQVRALPSGPAPRQGSGHAAVRKVLDRIAGRWSMPNDDPSPDEQRYQLALRRAREERRTRPHRTGA